jgi:hypothetical protein
VAKRGVEELSLQKLFGKLERQEPQGCYHQIVIIFWYSQPLRHRSADFRRCAVKEFLVAESGEVDKKIEARVTALLGSFPGI